MKKLLHVLVKPVCYLYDWTYTRWFDVSQANWDEKLKIHFNIKLFAFLQAQATTECRHEGKE